jgi:hypothetical protein
MDAENQYKRAMKPGGRIHAVYIHIEATEPEKSALFYQEVVGFEVVFKDSTEGLLERDCIQLGISLPKQWPDRPLGEIRRQVIRLFIADVVGMHAHVQSLSGRYSLGRNLRISKSTGGFGFADPSGNVVTVEPLDDAPKQPSGEWQDPMNRDELLTIKQLPAAIGCTPRFVTAMLRAGYNLQFPALKKTTPLHALSALEFAPDFRAPPYLKYGWERLPKLLADVRPKPPADAKGEL